MKEETAKAALPKGADQPALNATIEARAGETGKGFDIDVKSVRFEIAD